METVTWAVLKDAVRRKVGMPRREAAQLVDDVIETICERLVAGKRVKISGLGSCAARGKGRRALSEQIGLSRLARSLSVQECKTPSGISTVRPRSSGSL